MKVAELLVNNGFKEAYAIKGGISGKRGWRVSSSLSKQSCISLHLIFIY